MKSGFSLLNNFLALEKEKVFHGDLSNHINVHL